MKWLLRGLTLLIVFIALGSFQTAFADDDMLDIAAVQEILNKIGYECGPADGIKGSRTAAAIQLFQKIHAINENCVIDAETKQALLRAEEEKRVTDYLLRAVPELQEVVGKHKNEDLIFYVQNYPRQDKNDKYQRDYYNVYIGVHVMEHRMRMANFLVSKKLNEVLWDNPANGKYVSVEEWRKSRSDGESGEQDKSVANDWRCVPFQRVGPITPSTAADDLAELFGAGNVQRRTIPGAEGAEYFDVSVIYPDTPNEAVIFWQKNRYGSVPQTVIIRRAGSAWKTVQGVRVGTSLEELNRLNGRTFTIRGFGWDYGGYVLSWKGGTLETAKGLSLRLRPTRMLPAEFNGERVKLDSGNPVLLPDAIQVCQLEIMLTANQQ